MTPTANDRDRLMRAFALLDRHGVVACAGLPTTTHEGHALLRERLAARYPNGMGSYVFSTRSEEMRFDARGRLRAPLPLHCSTDEVAVAVRAACVEAGLHPQAIAALAAREAVAA